MGLHHSPSIVTDGLIMCLDAGNPRSYTATSGNNWIDLSGNGFSGNLTANTSYDSANLGSIVFDGTTTSRFELANTNYPTTWTSPITIDTWIRISSAHVWDTVYRSPIVIRGSYQGHIAIARATSDNRLVFSVRGSTLNPITGGAVITRDVWHHVVGIWNGRIASIGINGKIVSTSSVTTADGTPSSAIWTVGGNNALSSASSTTGLNGNVSSVKIYNRALSSNEIQQNFNALRPRYGL